MYGSERWISEPQLVKRWAYRLFGGLHVPGRIRGNHITREIRGLGLMKRPIRMLDAGSGRGELVVHLAKCCPNWEIVGIEQSEQRIETARHTVSRLGLSNVSILSGDLEQLDFNDEFDLIVNADVLEHIEDDRKVLRNLFGALKPGGHVIITSPSIPQRKHLWLVRWRENRIGFSPSEYGHVRDGYSKQDIEDKFLQSGGKPIHTYFTFGFFGTLAFDVFFVIGDNKPNPIVFALCYPFLLALGVLDLYSKPKIGSAILAVGTKCSE